MLIPSMVTWFGYNSALSQADEEAIEWLNEQDVSPPVLEGVVHHGCLISFTDIRAEMAFFARLSNWREGTYTCSAEIAPWIYGRYVDMRYVDRIEDADYVVLRTEPMTPRCDEDNIFFNRDDAVVEEEFEMMELLTQFRDGMTVVKIYRGGYIEQDAFIP